MTRAVSFSFDDMQNIKVHDSSGEVKVYGFVINNIILMLIYTIMWANLSAMNSVNMNLVHLTNLPKISSEFSKLMFNLTIIKYRI